MKKKSTWGKQYNKALNLIDRNNDLLDELVKDIVDLSFKPILILTDGVVVHANNESVKLFGLPIKSLKGNRVEDLFVYPTGTLLVKIFTKTSALKGYQTDNALKLVSISGKECRVQPRAKKIQWKGKASLMFEFKNIGTQERADVLSAFSYDNLRQALLLAKLGTWEYDISDGKASVGQEFFSILGYNANDVKTNSLSWEKVLHPDSLQGFHAMIDNLRQSKENTGYWEYKAKDSRNEYSWLMGVYQVTAWDANGEPLKIAGLQIDISEYKKCESEKNDALNIINCFFLNSNDGVALFDEKGVTVEWNKTMEQITGIKRDKIMGTIIWDNQESLPFYTDTPDNFVSLLKKTVLAIMHTGVNTMEGKTCETTVASKSGEIKYVQQSCFFIRQKAGLLFVTTLRDIT
ncbi:MAG: PAS domain-containing protein, partial [Tenuifilaceae bacterium]